MHQDVWHGTIYVSSMLELHHNDLLYDFPASYEEISNARARETQQSLTKEEPGHNYSVTIAKRVAFIICLAFLLSLLIAQDHNPTSWLATLLWGSLHGTNPAEYMLIKHWLRDIQMYHSNSANSVPFFWSPPSHIISHLQMQWRKWIVDLRVSLTFSGGLSTRHPAWSKV